MLLCLEDTGWRRNVGLSSLVTCIHPRRTSCVIIPMVIKITSVKEIALIFLVIALVISATSIFNTKPIGIFKENTGKIIKSLPTVVSNSNEIAGRRIVVLKVPAVDNQGNGIATTLKVEAMPGEGRILTNINQILFWVDTQYSIQTAKAVAGNLTNADLSKTDLIYSIETEAGVIEGPSAGAALTLATIAVLENKSITTSVAITGTINPDGTIGPVGGILAKAKASRDAGATLFLVPKGQGIQTIYNPVRQCEKTGSYTFCRIEYKKETVDITQQAGVEVKEVSSIQEALKYLLI